MKSKIILSWFALFLLGLCSATSCSAAENQQKWNRLENNIKIVLTNVDSYQNSLTKAENELKKSNLLLAQAEQKSKKLDEKLLLSRMECEAMQKSLENANSLLKSYEKSMKAEIRKQKTQKYIYATLFVGVAVASSDKMRKKILKF